MNFFLGIQLLWRKDQEIGGAQEHGFVKSTSDIVLLGQLKHHFKKSLKIK